MVWCKPWLIAGCIPAPGKLLGEAGLEGALSCFVRMILASNLRFPIVAVQGDEGRLTDNLMRSTQTAMDDASSPPVNQSQSEWPDKLQFLWLLKDV